MAIVAPTGQKPELAAEPPAATRREERRALGGACGAHVLHDGYTDLIWVALPIWQAEFGLSYAAVGFLRTIFSGTMETIVFSPYWNVPDSIAEGETAPAAARDPRFLERNHIEILRRGSDGVSAVEPSGVTIEGEDQSSAASPADADDDPETEES